MDYTRVEALNDLVNRGCSASIRLIAAGSRQQKDANMLPLTIPANRHDVRSISTSFHRFLRTKSAELFHELVRVRILSTFVLESPSKLSFPMPAGLMRRITASKPDVASHRFVKLLAETPTA